MFEEDTIKIHVERILKGPPSDDVWSVDARAWIDDDGEKKFQRPVRVNVLKNDGYFEDDGSGTLKLLNRLKDCYERCMREDERYLAVQSEIEDEKSKAEEIEGGTFEV